MDEQRTDRESGEGVGRSFRFSLKQLLIGMTLAVCGIPLVVQAVRLPSHQPGEDVMMWIIGGILIGAGVMLPFNRLLLGIFGGLAIQILLLVFFLAYAVITSPY